MTATLLALGAALTWGVGDFLGGLMSRRLPTTTVMVISQGFGLVAVTIAFLATGATLPDESPALHAIGAGALGALGLAAFYHALATGMVSLVAPIAATGVIVPVGIGLWGGEAVGATGFAGIATAISGVVLASVAPSGQGGADPTDQAVRTRSLALAVVAALLFGGYFAVFATATKGGLLGASLVQRLASLATVTAMWVVARRGQAFALTFAVPPGIATGTALAGLAGTGMLDIAANILYGGASLTGLLSLASVLSSLYPVVTVLLARLVLGERLAAVQGAGVVLALTGTTLIAVR